MRPPQPAPDAGGRAGTEPTPIHLGPDEVRVLWVLPDGPAARAGFQPGDRLLAGDGQELASEEAVLGVLGRARPDRKLFFEVRRGRQMLTLPLTTEAPGWLLLSGARLTGFLLRRIQGGPTPGRPSPGGPAPDLVLPGLDGRPIALRELRGRRVAILFFGTFSEPSYAALGAFGRVCAREGEGPVCLAVDALELFTAAGQTRAWAEELRRVRRELFPAGIMAVDLFMEAERLFGVRTLPSLWLVDPEGRLTLGQEGPMAEPDGELARLLEAGGARP
jgi:hypothetical protein